MKADNNEKRFSGISRRQFLIPMIPTWGISIADSVITNTPSLKTFAPSAMTGNI